MDTYSLLREFADSWVLLAMFLSFVGVIAFAFRPGSTRVYEDVSAIPFRNTTANEGEKTCSGQCETCACANSLESVKGLTNV